MSLSDHVKLFGMHNLLLETDLKKLEESGIQIGHARTIQRTEIVDVDLFESDILQEARQMADFYALYYSLENTIRRLISERLSEKYGPNWWKQQVPEGVQKEVDKKAERREGHNDVDPFGRSSRLYEFRRTHRHLRSELE